MSKPVYVERKLTDLKELFFVRVALDHGRVEDLGKLHDNGMELPPIIISTSDNPDLCDVIIDGRHRKVMYTQRDVKKVKCELRHYNTLAEMILDAWRANSGGALPPTQQDIIHTLQILVEAGQTRAAIIESVSLSIGLPPRLVRRQLDEVQSLIAKARVVKAKNDVLKNDLSVKEAAKKHKVDLKTLQRNLGMEKKEDKGSNQQMKASISTVAKKLSLTIGHNMSQSIRDLKDGVATEDVAKDTYSHLGNSIKKLVHVYLSWGVRLGTHLHTQLKTTVEVSGSRKELKPKAVVASASKPAAKSEAPDVAKMRANARRQFKSGRQPATK